MSKVLVRANSSASKTTLRFSDLAEAGIIKAIFHLWSPTVSCRVVGKIFYDEPVIYVFWHNKMFGLIRLMRKRGIHVLVSRHRDGEKIARVVKSFGYNFVRGSSSRGSIRALKELSRLLKKGNQIAITPDGPTGPRWQFKEGANFLSKITGVPIIFVGVGYAKKLVLNTWDRFEIPLPFSRCVVYSSPPYYVKRGDTAEKLGNLLKKATLRAEALSYGEI